MDKFSQVGLLAFMGWYASVFSNKKIIQQIGYSSRYYPKRYILPSRKMRRLFGLKKKEIPKWCYYQFFISFVYIGVFVVNTSLFMLPYNNFLPRKLFMIIFYIIMGIDEVYIMVCAFLYKV